MLAAWLLGLAAPVTASAPQAVSVTVYRNPHADPDDMSLDLEFLEGFALISETRTVTLPAGESEIRFEGVAGGLIPPSVVVGGLPDGALEKNMDARLLTPGALVDARLGKRVHIRRTDRATGKVTESDATLLSGPNGVVLRTAAGVEALRCSGMAESLLFDGVPAGLSDKPTLSVRARVDRPIIAQVRLSYLASDFDWRASYVAQLGPDGKTLDLFAWLTLANGNGESFAGAQTQAVAGTLNRDEEGGGDIQPSVPPAGISLNCWPAGTTSDVPYTVPPPPPPPGSYDMEAGDIVVTGTRLPEVVMAMATPVTVVMAEQEDLGDLKLYRIPEPVTVAAHAQKQVALLSKVGVPYKRLYGLAINAGGGDDDPRPAQIILRLKNEKARGLGLPLPAGSVAVFDAPLLLGEAAVADTAVGQEFDVTVGESPDVQVTTRRLTDDDSGDKARRISVEIGNASPRPVSVEVGLRIYGDWQIARPSRRLVIRNGRQTWATEVPDHGRAVLTYTYKPQRRRSVDGGDS
jgi:hypothetical protein